MPRLRRSVSFYAFLWSVPDSIPLPLYPNGRILKALHDSTPGISPDRCRFLYRSVVSVLSVLVFESRRSRAMAAITAILMALCLCASAGTPHPGLFLTFVANKPLSPFDPRVALAWPKGGAWVAQGPRKRHPIPIPNPIPVGTGRGVLPITECVQPLASGQQLVASVVKDQGPRGTTPT